MKNPITAYMRWLHTQWPAGQVEKLPEVNDDYTTRVPGLYVVGDLTGVPLLKFSADSGARVVQRIVEDKTFEKRDASDDVVDIAIIGGGVSGFSAAKEAAARGLDYRLFEATQPFSTIVNFPKAKPIYTYPTDMTPSGSLQFREKSEVKEGLLEDLAEQTDEIDVTHARVSHVKRTGGAFEIHYTPQASSGGRESEVLRARRVIVGIGRSGNFRKLGVPGEDLDKVYNRLHDPADYCGQNVLVVGGGDSAMETAIALTTCGANVTLSYRKPEFSRPKPENAEKIRDLVEHPDRVHQISVETVEGDRVTTPSGGYQGAERQAGRLTLMMSSRVKQVREGEVDVEDADGEVRTLTNDAVFTMIGREPPLEFFRRSGVPIRGERSARWWLTLVIMIGVFTFLYQWKKSGTWLPLAEWWEAREWFPFGLPDWLASLGPVLADPAGPLGTLRLSMGSPGFWFSLLYCSLIVVFGVRRIHRRRTPYIKWQTITLMAIQCVPLFLLPYLVFPWMGHLGLFDGGLGQAFADALFPAVDYDPHGREYWRAFGLILAWPLFIWNVFSNEPLTWWLIISLVQTFVLIPLGIYFWGKGVYCGWVCSCGAMAETLGDMHRHKMPHGPIWNRVNMIGQVFLAIALLMAAFRIASWVWPDAWVGEAYLAMLGPSKYHGVAVLNYAWFVDLFWAGILGFGLYFHFSGRVWCRFACPLAALMHIYARFSRFRILADKSKCISCNVCTSVCHQGIDIMNFANKGLPMADPECVRCSACVQQCPTGVLYFGQVDRGGNTIATDPAWLGASPVRMAELRVNGKSVAN